MKNKLEIAPELNVHHAFYHRALYRKKHEREFRNFHGFQIPTQVAVHNRLHHELFLGPPKPTKQEMSDCLDFVKEAHESFKTERFWGVEAAMKYFIIAEFDNEADTERYRATRLHLAHQIGALSRKSTGIELPSVEELYQYGKAA